jgi:hypothetical protein
MPHCDASIVVRHKPRLRFNVESLFLMEKKMTTMEDKVINEIIQLLKSKLRKATISSMNDRSLSAPRFVFLCGKAFVEGQESIRDYTINILNKFEVENVYGTKNMSTLCIISERLYGQDLSEDIFSFEKMLAEISDKIIIVAESPGTFCELGAFVMDDNCRAKTIVINEDNEDFKKSFITNGPIKMLENESENKVILHNGLERLKDSLEYGDKIKEIAKENLTIYINNNPNEIRLKSLIYELTNIIELFQPLEPYDIEVLYKELKGFNSYSISNKAGHKIRNIRQVLALMVQMKILQKKEGYYLVNKEISCYNTMFKITRKEFNDIRIAYLNRMEKLKPKRMEIL